MSAQFATDEDWPSILDSLQEHVECVERLVRRGAPDPLPAWVPPRGAYGLPQEQVERASALLERLEAVMTTVELAAGAVHHEMDFVRAASISMSATRSNFIDASL